MGRGALNGGAWTDSDAQRSGGFNVFSFSSFYSFEFLLKTKHSTVNCQPLRSFSRVKPVGDRLHRQQTHAKVKLTGSFPDKVGDYAPVVSLQGVIPRRYASQFFLPSTVQIKRARFRRMALSVQRSLVHFVVRSHSATLC